jgi:hypothetical protein
LTACWSTKGLAHLLFERAPASGWSLITADYCLSEVEKNVRKHPSGASRWRQIVRARLTVVGSVYVLGSVVYGVKVRTPRTFLLELGVVESS